MNNIWFTSDLHINHNKEFLWGPRGFVNEKEMNDKTLNYSFEYDDLDKELEIYFKDNGNIQIKQKW